MTTIDLSPVNMPTVFSDMVSNATANLPPLTREQDSDFLLDMLGEVIEFFWGVYVAQLPEDQQKEFQIALDEDSEKKMEAWQKKYSNFIEDQDAMLRGRNILETISAKLPQVLAEEYENYTNDSYSS